MLMAPIFILPIFCCQLKWVPPYDAVAIAVFEKDKHIGPSWFEEELKYTPTLPKLRIRRWEALSISYVAGC